MIKHAQDMALDDIDKATLRALQVNGRLTNIELAQQINLSPPAAHARMKRLQKDGYVRSYTAIVDREKAGYDLLCFVHVSLQIHQVEQVDKFHKQIRQMPEVLECHHITGEYDYLLKVALRNRQDMQRFIVDRLTPVAGVSRIHTSLALNEIKSTTALPLE
jgi:DNA-binding Lrp family transcriptional regulator